MPVLVLLNKAIHDSLTNFVVSMSYRPAAYSPKQQYGVGPEPIYFNYLYLGYSRPLASDRISIIAYGFKLAIYGVV